MRKLVMVGICGTKGVGKDEVARVLVQEHGFYRRGMGDALKEACQIIFGIDGVEMSSEDKEKVAPFGNLTPRQIWQIFGTEAMREGFGQKVVSEGLWEPGRAKDLWVDAMRAHIRQVEQRKLRGEPGPLYIVIPDVRFHNEAKFIQANQGLMIHVTRKGVTLPTYGKSSRRSFRRRLSRLIPWMREGIKGHASEDGLRLEDLRKEGLNVITLTNDGTLSDLNASVSQLWREYQSTL